MGLYYVTKEEINKIVQFTDNEKSKLYNILNYDLDVSYQHYYREQRLKIYFGPDETKLIPYISACELVEMPGCCGILISTHAWVSFKYQKLGLGTFFNNYRKRVAKELGYGLLICTDKAYNIPQQRILEKNGWRHIETFNNPRTGNIIRMHSYDLNEG